MNNCVRVGKRRAIVSRSCESYSKICSLNGLVKREDGMELGPYHIGKNRGRYTYIDPTVAEAVPLGRELSGLGEPSLSGVVMGMSGAPRKQADMLRGDNFSRERGHGYGGCEPQQRVWPQSPRELVRRTKVQLASALGTEQRG